MPSNPKGYKPQSDPKPWTLSARILLEYNAGAYDAEQIAAALNTTAGNVRWVRRTYKHLVRPTVKRTPAPAPVRADLKPMSEGEKKFYSRLAQTLDKV